MSYFNGLTWCNAKDPAGVRAIFTGGSGFLEFPRIVDFDAQTGEVPNVPRGDRQVMFNGGCGNHAIRRVEGRSSRLALSIQHAPSPSYGCVTGRMRLRNQIRRSVATMSPDRFGGGLGEVLRSL